MENKLGESVSSSIDVVRNNSVIKRIEGTTIVGTVIGGIVGAAMVSCVTAWIVGIGELLKNFRKQKINVINSQY